MVVLLLGPGGGRKGTYRRGGSVERENGDREGLGEPGSRYRRVVQALVAANAAAAVVLVVVLLTGSDDTPEAVVSTVAPPAAPPSAPPGDPAATPEGGLEAGGEGDASVSEGGSGAGGSGAGGSGAGGSGAGIGMGAATPADPATAGSVASAFLTPPQEFSRVADATADTGPLDLEDVVRLDASDATLARSRFVELGFRSAHSRAWQTQTDSLLVVAYEFADERGAATFVGEASALRRADPDAAQITLAGVPGAAAFQLEIPGDPTQAVFLSRGPRAYLVGLVGPSAADPQAELLRRLAAAQYDAAL